MQERQLGQTSLALSILGFGCGAVGGMLVRGQRQEMLDAVAYALDQGITYFDTAALYGNGESERNLGLVLEELRAQVVVGTKVQLVPEQFDAIEQAIITSVDTSLRQLRREQIDLIQLHNPIGMQRRPERQWVSPGDVEKAIETFRKLHQHGKVRFWGINGLGDTGAIHQALALGPQTIQSCYNLLNHTAVKAAPAGFPFQDYRQLIAKAAERQMGVIAIRVLAGGALSGSAERHPHAAQRVDPIASGSSFAEDVERSRRFDFLVDDGYATTLAEAAIRFAITTPEISTTLVGISSLEQLKQAVSAANRGPLPPEALDRLQAVWEHS
jgi:aryl-alcohol dehydrogenase-like predicted oxidoreductase